MATLGCDWALGPVISDLYILQDIPVGCPPVSVFLRLLSLVTSPCSWSSVSPFITCLSSWACLFCWLCLESLWDDSVCQHRLSQDCVSLAASTHSLLLYDAECPPSFLSSGFSSVLWPGLHCATNHSLPVLMFCGLHPCCLALSLTPLNVLPN